MSRKLIAAVIISSACFIGALAQDQPRTYTRADFINVEGASLNDKLDRALQQFKASKQGESVWLAYHFPARAGVSIGPWSGMIYRDDDGVRLERRDSPEGAAVFLLADLTGGKTAFTRVKTLNLNEPYQFENRPVYWLGNVDAEQSVARLEALMRADAENKNLVRSVLRALSSHNSARVVPLLKEIAAKEQSYDLQRAAIASLGRVATKEGLDALDELFSSATSVSLKQEIVRAYTYAGDRVSERRVLDRLTALAKSNERLEVRQEAVRRIAGFRGDAVADRLFEIYDAVSEAQLKREIISHVSLNDSRDDRTAKRLLTIAKQGGDPEVQRAAVRRLSSVRGDEQLDALIELYDTVNVDAVKEEVINRLARSESKKAMDKLKAIATNDPNPRLRQAAIRRLSSSRSANVSFNGFDWNFDFGGFDFKFDWPADFGGKFNWRD